MYQLTTTGPSTSETRNVPAASVVHVRLTYDRLRPWYGVSPLQHAVETGRLHSELERTLADEAAGPVGQVLPIPEGQQEGDDDDNPKPLAALRDDLRRLRGNLATVETMARGYGDAASAPHGDWSVKRFGPAPPASLGEVRAAVERSILAALGVPVGLLSATAAATLRESWRLFVASSVQPLGRLVEAELRDKLDAPGLKLEFGSLAKTDLATRSRALKGMIDAGIKLEEARSLAGL